MGRRNKREDSLTEDRHTTCSNGASSSSSSSSVNEALLFTTLCLIGLPVDVHIRDGSVYSGIFHSASVVGDYDIVLKKARMTKQGKGKTNLEKDDLVDTLVIRSVDLVQLVAKGVMLPSDCVGGNITGDDEEAVVNNVSCYESPTCEVENHREILVDGKLVNQSRCRVQNDSPSSAMSEYEGKKLPVNQTKTSLEVDCAKTDKMNSRKIEAVSGSSFSERQAGDDKSKGNADDWRQNSEFVKGKTDEKIQSCHSTHETDTCLFQVEAVEHRSSYVTSNPSDNGLHCNNTPSFKAGDRFSDKSTADSASMCSIQGVDLISESHNLPAKSVEISAKRGTDSTRNPKQFKLNPAAKVFSPSSVNPVCGTTAMPTTANMIYIPNSSPMAPVAAIQPEAGFNTFTTQTSVPVKVSQYSNLTGGNGGVGSQFSRPIVGQLAHRAQPVRYGAHYTPVLSEPAFLQPSSAAVMVGRSGQLVYIHPVSHDLVHGTTANSPVSARPMLNHVQYPKLQGGTVGQTMPVCVPPPVLTSVQQPFAVQSHIPLLQPGFPVTRPISVPGPNGFYGAKFS